MEYRRNRHIRAGLAFLLTVARSGSVAAVSLCTLFLAYQPVGAMELQGHTDETADRVESIRIAPFQLGPSTFAASVEFLGIDEPGDDILLFEQSDRKIIFASTAAMGGKRPFLARINPAPDNGMLSDPDFGENGTVVGVRLPARGDAKVEAIAEQYDGRLLLLSSDPYNVVPVVHIERFLPSGLVDRSWGTMGTLTIDKNRWSFATDLTLQDRGRLLVAAGTSGLPGVDILRLSSDGAFDTSFGAAGVLAVSPCCVGVDHLTDRIFSTADGFILIDQADDLFATDADPQQLELRAYRSDGAINVDFGKVGVLSISLPLPRQSGSELNCVMRTDESFACVVRGLDLSGVCCRTFVVSATADGHSDTSFGENGIVWLEAKPVLIPAPGGALLLLPIGAERQVIRLRRDGSLDTDFGDHGRTTISTPFGEGVDFRAWVATREFKLLAAGFVTQNDRKDWFLSRFEFVSPSVIVTATITPTAIVEETPTPLASAEPTLSASPPVTVTPTAPSRTYSATPDTTETARPQGACTGDCDGDQRVTINELIEGVDLALGIVPLEYCRAFDSSGDGKVEINELVQAIVSALDGC